MTPVTLPSLFALLKPSMRRVLAARGHRQQQRGLAAWSPPSCDCYALLGVSRSASAQEIKKAYLKKAMEKHPDTEGGGTDQMAQLNLCYEALTKKRSEYDAAKGVGGSGARASAYSASSSYASSSREPWWKAQSGRPEDYSDLGAEWEDLFYGRAQGRTSQRARNSSRPGANSWQEWAHTWRQEHNASSEYRRQASSQRGRRTRQTRFDTDSESEFESDSDWEEEYFRSNRRKKKQSSNPQTGRKSRATTAGSREGGKSDGSKYDDWDDRFDFGNEKKARSRPWQEEKGAKPPADIWISVPSPSKRGPVPENWSKLSGQFKLLEMGMNGQAAYQKAGNKGLYLFWSKEYGDWKLAERFEDDGSCLAYAEDPRGNKAPWKPFAPRWKLWEPNSRRFVLRKLNVVGCDPTEGEDDDDEKKKSKGSGGSSAGSKKEENEEEGGSSSSTSSKSSKKGHVDDDDDQIPWSRPPWNQWSTNDLRRWCDRNGIDIKSCFDRESLLERVVSAANQTQSGKASSSRRKPKYKDFDQESSDYSEDDEEDDARHRKRSSSRRPSGRQSSERGQQVRLASRVKTDGSYTKAPSLDKRVSLFGNRIERFRGRESDVLPWLYDYGDKSRLYGVFAGGSHNYSLVWKRGQYWGRPSMRDGPRHDRDYYW